MRVGFRCVAQCVLWIWPLCLGLRRAGWSDRNPWPLPPQPAVAAAAAAIVRLADDEEAFNRQDSLHLIVLPCRTIRPALGRHRRRARAKSIQVLASYGGATVRRPSA